MKETCKKCTKSIQIGQNITECNSCNTLNHTKCLKNLKPTNVSHWTCDTCTLTLIPRYNPFVDWEGTETDKNYGTDCVRIVILSSICSWFLWARYCPDSGSMTFVWSGPEWNFIYWISLLILYNNVFANIFTWYDIPFLYLAPTCMIISW